MNNIIIYQRTSVLRISDIPYEMCGQTKESHMTTVKIMDTFALHLNERTLYETLTIWRLQ